MVKACQSCPALVTPWCVVRQAPFCPWNFPGENTGGVAISCCGDLPHTGIEAASPVSPALAGGFFTSGATWEAYLTVDLEYSYSGYF